MTALAEAIVTAFTAYLGAGLVFAVLFVAFGVHRVDEQAKGSGAGFRLIILPGVAALWPLLLARWVRGVSEPRLETNGHRARAIDGGLL
jgi:hypothetical protein